MASLYFWWPSRGSFRGAIVEPPIAYLESTVCTAACEMAIIFDFMPEERTVHDIDGLRFYILDPFTYLRITSIKASGLSPSFSWYLAASGHEERLVNK
jgi:hypothetical protein